MSKEQTPTIVTPVFRLAWPHLFEKAKNMKGEETGYDITMLFPKTEDLSALKKLAWEAGRRKWPKKFEDTSKGWPAGLRNVFRDGEEKAEYDGYPGSFFARATTQFKVQIVDRDKTPLSDPDRVYAGVYARAFVNAYAYDSSGNRGVNFGLLALQIVRDGERLGGGSVDAASVDWGTDVPDAGGDDW